MKRSQNLVQNGVRYLLAGIGLACTPEPASAPTPAPPPWQPGVTYSTVESPNDRGLLDRRGLIHAHSVYSHDACDNDPVKNGERDAVCFEDFRRGVCQSKHDFVMLTDHKDAFSEIEFPETLLHRPERGDLLVERSSIPVASWAACEDGQRTLILAGSESGLMPVGIEGHPVSLDERSGLYGNLSEASAEVLRAQGAVILLAHTEEFTPDDLLTLPIDGFEMYNLHANALSSAGTVLELLLRNQQGDTGLSHPDLAGLHIIEEDPRYLDTWAAVMARGGHHVTTMGTDCHRNTFPALLSDGERVDSYRRMMSWFSNHLLIRPDADGQWDDRHAKEALAAGRLYGAFEVMGYPVGFDYFAEAAAGIVEMGSDVALSDRPELVVRMPRVQNLDPSAQPPDLLSVIYLARETGWEEVSRTAADELRFVPAEPGVYRAEIRMLPMHLQDAMNDDDMLLLANDRIWVMSNPIFIRSAD